jgi:hypothetical protein
MVLPVSLRREMPFVSLGEAIFESSSFRRIARLTKEYIETENYPSAG